MEQINIGKNDDGRRIDAVIARFLPGAGKAFIYKMLRKKNIVLNGKKAEGSDRVAEGDMVTLFLSEETINKFKTVPGEAGSGAGITPKDLKTAFSRPGEENIQKRSNNPAPSFDFKNAIVYEDGDVIIINKPAGILSQKAQPQDVSVNEYLIDYCLKTGRISDEELKTFKPSVCNRLDRNTSGLLCAGVSLKGLRELSKLIRERSLDKYYCCLVEGSVSHGAHLVSYLKKDPKTNKVEVKPDPFEGADKVELEYRPLDPVARERLLSAGDRSEAVKLTAVSDHTPGHTWLEIKLITGKSHQIRAQLAAIGHPIAGDLKYGSRTMPGKSVSPDRRDATRTQAAKTNTGHIGAPAGIGVSLDRKQVQFLCAYRLVFPQDTTLEQLAGKEFRI